MWERRAELVVAGTPTYVPSVSGDYMGWYYSITRLFVSSSFRLPTHHYQPSSLALHLTVSILVISKVSHFIYVIFVCISV
ncbi:unnamed protein product [Cuscuta epithymum]|uniref:Uncharacterized protein n=1 Tax=Cuscuta epithymum TaxID=186058 RepID=A0AAV0G9X9_9ASTE|nr:unnamed protein product [Cuscuta epithymum]